MTIGDPILNISIFGAFVVITLVIVLRASRNKQDRRRLLRGGTLVHRIPKRHGDCG